ncbi:hypothetical protein ACFOQM_02860 [Paenibacillus sp. GCM10012307]|uniref:Agl cluster protein AglQ n=1 Tax=Paenibacillus roseus TaxID=2798579 RepID=A0A934IVV9_9BACL|nr:hypothetical protein [Paenibacillus roseus]MBJ6360257.1 hypothetical protein [Paenibacillus roseus]
MVAEWKEIVIGSATRGLELQGKKGDMPPGHNGPWNDPQTPVRNTAHWSLLFLEAFKHTGNEAFKDAALKAAGYLASHEARPMNATFYCRYAGSKDFCNGLIGQAWVIQALLYIGEHFQQHQYIDLAQEIFLLHEMDHSSGLWRIRNVDGSIGGISHTFNQQLWFAVMGVMLNKLQPNKTIEDRTNLFFAKMMDHLQLARSGRIIHVIGHVRLRYRIIKSVYRLYFNRHQREHQYLLEHGYHSFNLYAFALLYHSVPDHFIWKMGNVRNMLKRAIDYTKNPEFKATIQRNKYSSPYNPVGIEMACVLTVFKDYLEDSNIQEVREWSRLQLEQHYDHEQHLMNQNTSDPDTLSARLYEAGLILEKIG